MVQNIRRLLEQAHELVLFEEFDEALKIYDKLLAINPKNVSTLIDKAVTLQKIGKSGTKKLASIKTLQQRTEN